MKRFLKAISCFEDAGKNGHGRSFYELGLIYENDGEFRKNMGFAIDCFQRAIENGYYENYRRGVRDGDFRNFIRREDIFFLGTETAVRVVY